MKVVRFTLPDRKFGASHYVFWVSHGFLKIAIQSIPQVGKMSPPIARKSITYLRSKFSKKSMHSYQLPKSRSSRRGWIDVRDPLCSEGMHGASDLLKVFYISFDCGRWYVTLSSTSVQVEVIVPYAFCLTWRKRSSIVVHESLTAQKFRASV